MKIVQYIYKLLQDKGSITIPELGAFILKDTSTRIDSVHKVIQPPSQVLTFNESIKDNDHILAGYIAGIEGISSSEAENAVKKFVEQLKALLNSGKTIEFSNIGKLHLNHKKQIVFDYDSKAAFISETFGLTPVKIHNFHKPKEVKQVVIKPREVIVKKQKKAFPKAAIWLIIILVPIITIIVLAFVFPVKTEKIFIQSKEYVTGLFRKKEAEKIVQNPIVINEVNNDSLKTIKTDTAATKPLPVNPKDNVTISNNKKPDEKRPVTDKVADENKKFHIIVGCFQSRSNAEKYFKTISDKGYSPRFFEAGPDGLFKISCASYATRNEAQSELKKAIDDLGTQAWILKK